jgi:hypothetical protein
LSLLLAGLELLHIITCIQGDLKPLTPCGNLEVNDSLDVFYDNKSSRQHELERKTYHHKEKLSTDQLPFHAYDPLKVFYDDDNNLKEKLAEGQSLLHASAHHQQLEGGDPLSTGISSAALRASCLEDQ